VNPLALLDVGRGAPDWETVLGDRIALRNTLECHLVSRGDFSARLDCSADRKDVTSSERIDCDRNVVIRMNPHDAMLSSDSLRLRTLDADRHAAGSA